MNFKVGGSLAREGDIRFSRYINHVLKLVDYKFNHYLGVNFITFKLLIFFDKKDDNVYDYLKALSVVSFLTRQRGCVNVEGTNVNVLLNLNESGSLSLLKLLFKKYFIEEEFKLMFIRKKFNNRQWNFAFKNISTLFDLSLLLHDYYLWKYSIQVLGSFNMSEEILGVLFSGCNILIKK